MRVTTRRLADLDALLSAMDRATDRYMVAWIDTSANRRSFGRGILDVGDHVTEPGAGDQAGLAYRAGRDRRAPATPFSLFNPLTARAFNGLWYRRAPREQTGFTGLAPLPVSGWMRSRTGIARWARAASSSTSSRCRTELSISSPKC
jgi:decaprenylphospho-beta-D-ribofuranose 2-oxidase